MFTVPQAARRAGRDPETVRRWIRSGRLPATKVGTQHVIDEADLDKLMGAAPREADLAPVPVRWRTFDSGHEQPDWVSAIHRSRRDR